MATSAEQAIDNMTKAQAMPCVAPSGTAQCPEGRIRIGVFFDGTNNSMRRDGKVDAMNPGEAGNAPTNVVKLYRVYDAPHEPIQRAIYHHGVGTDSYAKKGEGSSNRAADWRGNAFGAGGKARVTWGLEQLADFFSQQNNHLAKEKLFDTYGFSRGAAIARDFVNNVRSIGIDNLKKQNGWKYRAVGRVTIREKAYERHTGVSPAFLGVFDTVASFGLGGLDSGNSLAGYNLFVDSSWVQRTVHMAAEDEIRGNFPLSSLFMDPNSKDSQNPSDYAGVMIEIWYPGAHSDVGGGYVWSQEEGEPEKRWAYYDDFGERHEVVIPAKPAPPPKLPHMALIPLRDMYRASKRAEVPLTGPPELSGIGEVEPSYNEYDAYRKGTPYEKRYIQTFPTKEYRKMYYDERDAQPSVQHLKLHFIHDSRWFHDKALARKQRTVLYMGPQPKGK